MTDTYALMRSLCETKQRATKRSKWRPPSQAQLAIESSLTSAIKVFIGKSKLSRHGIILPDETDHNWLLDAIHEALETAVYEGQGIANKEQERGIISAVKNLAGRAVQLISDITSTMQDKAKEILDKLFGSGDVDDPEAVLGEAQSEFEEWADSYSEGVAENEVQTAVQETIVDEMTKQGIELFDLLLDPEACPICVDIWNKNNGVVSSKGPLPPFHMRCRCGTDPHEE